MANSFFNKLTSSLNIQKEDDDAADFYQALDDAQAQERGQENYGAPTPESGGGEEYSPTPEEEPEEPVGQDPEEEGYGNDAGNPEGNADDAEGASSAMASLAVTKSRSSVRERASAAGRQARRIFSPMPMEDDDAEGQLAIDVYQTDSEIVIKSVIAGVQPEDLDITIGDDTVTIRGARKKDEQVSNENYFYQECYWGSFSRSVILPVEIDRERAEASFKNGILTIRLPKLEKNRTKKIPIAME